MRCDQRIEIKIGNNRRLVPCGRCLQCNISRQQSWVCRMMLEAQCNVHSIFLTLTYADNWLPDHLDYNDISRFLKRFRESTRDFVRFFCVGELGRLTKRPHWHLILYTGVQTISGHGFQALTQWPQGGAYVGDATPQSMGYVARYALKSAPTGHEFVAQMSRRPGIGLRRMREIGAHCAREVDELEKVPGSLKIGKRYFPLDRSMRKAFTEGYLGAGGVLDATDHTLRYDLEAAIIQKLGGEPRGPGLIKLERMRIRELERGSKAEEKASCTRKGRLQS